jgi:hypothetical protein
VRNCNKSAHEIRKLAEVALNILGRTERANWLLRHDRRSVSCPAAKVNMACFIRFAWEMK